ncbi:MAG: hypothetical protein E7665_06235 [Ruminococcaceae bacterium]|nr:hypothetical protein [Oscillospiraceae bacterium]
MLQYEIAKKLYEEIKEKAAKTSIEGFDILYASFLDDAVDYAAIRTKWSFMSRIERMENDSGRTAKHDSVISMLNAVCRNLGIEGIDEIMPDRKTKGDFACYVALFLGLEQR